MVIWHRIADEEQREWDMTAPADTAIYKVASTATLCKRANGAAALLKLMANDQRLILLCRLRDGEASVGELVGLCNLSQSSVSQHLARLRDAGLVDTRREQTTIYYHICSEDVLHLLDYLCDRFGEV